MIQLDFPSSSAGKESACNAEDLGSIPGLGRSPGEGIGYPLQYSWDSLVAQMVKKYACNMGDLGSIPGSERSPKGGNGYPLQYSCLENSMDRGAWRTTANGVTRVGHDLIKLRTKSNDLRKRSEEEACLKFSRAEGKLRPP